MLPSDGATNVDWVDRSGLDRNFNLIRSRFAARDLADIEGAPGFWAEAHRNEAGWRAYHFQLHP
jgi:hypothetical protein